MPKKDISQLAKFIVDRATGDAPIVPELTGRAKAGRLGGLKGGAKRAITLAKERRVEIAKNAAKTRWKAEAEEG